MRRTPLYQINTSVQFALGRTARTVFGGLWADTTSGCLGFFDGSRTNLLQEGTQVVTALPGVTTVARGKRVVLNAGSVADKPYQAMIGSTGTNYYWAYQPFVNENAQMSVPGSILPDADNTRALGSASFRFSTVYAGTGTINTSDATEKQWRGALTDAEKAAMAEIRASIGMYQWLDAIAEKGADKARYHCGVLAQNTADILTKHGLDPWSYSFMCRDPKMATRPATRTVTRQKMETITVDQPMVTVVDGKAVQGTASTPIERPAFEELPLFDASGAPIWSQAPQPKMIIVQDLNADGSPVLDENKIPVAHHEIALDGAGEPIIETPGIQATYHDPIMETVTEDYDEEYDTGDFIWGVRPTDMIFAMLAAS